MRRTEAIDTSKIIIKEGEKIGVERRKEIRTDRIEDMIRDNRANMALSYGHTATIVSVDIVESIGQTTLDVLLIESLDTMPGIVQINQTKEDEVEISRRRMLKCLP